MDISTSIPDTVSDASTVPEGATVPEVITVPEETTIPPPHIDPQKLNLHFYDNQIECDPAIRVGIEQVKGIDKIHAFNKLRQILDVQALPCLNAIIDDYLKYGRVKSITQAPLVPENQAPVPPEIEPKVISNPNYDPSNDFFACDLLYLCHQKLEDCTDPVLHAAIIEQLVTQLIDMLTGLCPPGRTSRLYQVLLAYVD